MRRLDILLAGQSQALTDLALELEQHGHALTRVTTFDEQLPEHIDLVIDDASLQTQVLRNVPRLTLQLGVDLSAASGLPALDLLCSVDSLLLTRVPIADEPSGNGQTLRLRAMAELVDHVSLLVSRYSRDAEYFLLAEPATAVHFAKVENLLFLDSLAFVHRRNATARPRLLKLAEQSMIERLEQRLILSAERPALNVAGTTLDYRQLHALSRAD